MGKRMNRDDLSKKLIHFTKGEESEAANTLQRILFEGKLRGGSGFIKGGFKCVCFTESPIGKISQILSGSLSSNFSYAPFGIMVDKLWLFKQGGRPVFYQSEQEYELLHNDQKYRHKRYEPDNGIDFTWEREWRIKTDELPLDPNQTTVIVPSRKWEENWIEKHMGHIRFAVQSLGDLGAQYVEQCQWHFIVLEDLGL